MQTQNNSKQRQIQAILKIRRSTDVDRVISSIMRWSPYTNREELEIAGEQVKAKIADGTFVIKELE